MPSNFPMLTILVFLFDLLAAVIAWSGGLLIRFNFVWPSGGSFSPLLPLAALLPLHAVACWQASLYRGIWRFASVRDFKRILGAIAVSAGGLAMLKALLDTPGPDLPRAMLVLYPLLLAAIMCGARLAWRMLKESITGYGLSASGMSVVIVGAGHSGKMLINALGQRTEWRPVALLDDDRSKWGRELSGIPIEGGIDALGQTLEKYQAAHVILAIPSAPPAAIRHATNLAVAANAKVFIVPGIEELMCGRVEIDVMRPVEMEDLLGREPVRIDAEHVHRVFARRTILVTGAGGSIGSELCRQIAKFEPEKLLLLEISEFALYSITEWFAHHQPAVKIIPLIGDIRDETRLKEIFSFWQPQAIFHAAAYKHVPLMEIGNTWQAVRNNVLGTLRLARCAQQHGAKHFTLISTDKAVNPTNIMGATKRLAEMVCQALSMSGSLHFGIVRFGNVLGSSGSVVPKFQAQIARGGPVTVTHPEITRYFMSIPEAAQLVLQAAAQEGNGKIFVLDMGEPVKIIDLARNMIHLSGYTEAQIGIEFTGLRPGEKLYEELLADTEKTLSTPHPKLRIARSRQVGEGFLGHLQNWLDNPVSPDDETVRRDIRQWVAEYAPLSSETPPLLHEAAP
ncbi:MAG: polysaccharide biosynthesis protein [Azoarcus sp.]|jgi:FlaA1/EpsC-like NDP-sugar epimerase|nr:polysaccharide biosynthesis protein [Azoarcus sp.]